MHWMEHFNVWRTPFFALQVWQQLWWFFLHFSTTCFHLPDLSRHSFLHRLAFTIGAWYPGGLNYWSPLTITYPTHRLTRRLFFQWLVAYMGLHIIWRQIQFAKTGHENDSVPHCKLSNQVTIKIKSSFPDLSLASDSSFLSFSKSSATARPTLSSSRFNWKIKVGC